jgi:adenosine deaminase CECR1
MVGSPAISIHSWKQLALWSLEYSCLNPVQKKQGKEYFLKSWNEFCSEVIRDYQHLFDSNGNLNKEETKRHYDLMKEAAEQTELAEKVNTGDESD